MNRISYVFINLVKKLILPARIHCLRYSIEMNNELTVEVPRLVAERELVQSISRIMNAILSIRTAISQWHLQVIVPSKNRDAFWQFGLA